MSQVLTQASHEWMKRPNDERFTSLVDMLAHFNTIRNQSSARVVPSRRLEAIPAPNDEMRGLLVATPDGAHAPTNWAFGQLAGISGAPAGYLRTLPAPIAADCINYGLQFKREIDDIGMLTQDNGSHSLRAVTGPNYGRIWNADIIRNSVERFGDGATGQWKVPSEFGKTDGFVVTKANTTLYASDRDMFIFLCDEENRIEVPNRRDGKSGSLARGFFMWNSEVGASTFGIGTFLFDYACRNRMVWGAEGYEEIRIRHTASAPDKYIDEVRPVIEAYAHSSAEPITKMITSAREARISGADGKLDEFLTKRFSKKMSATIQATHVAEEGRPIESMWDVATAVTAYARGIEHQDERLILERKAGQILTSASK